MPTIDLFNQPSFDGTTFNHTLDHERLSTALGRVWSLMKDGQERTLAAIAYTVGCSEAGASARLRDLRKRKFQLVFGCWSVESRRADGGLWVYKLVKDGISS